MIYLICNVLFETSAIIILTVFCVENKSYINNPFIKKIVVVNNSLSLDIYNNYSMFFSFFARRFGHYLFQWFTEALNTRNLGPGRFITSPSCFLPNLTCYFFFYFSYGALFFCRTPFNSYLTYPNIIAIKLCENW